MERNFENFLSAYEDYTEDSFVPPQFNTWCGITAISAALERKVWLPWTDTFSYYPNMFVLLVAKPGVGKSTALNKAVGLLQDMNSATNSLHLVPSQITEAKFIETMGQQTSFQYGTRVINQSSGFYFASEASNSLRNIYGDFLACLTDFYDCPTHWEKATLKDDKITLRNVCLNLIAGSTFEYLSRLISAEQVMGGFASRLVYVVHDTKMVRDQDFQAGMTAERKAKRAQYRKLLVEDLTRIHKMVGPFTGTPEFGKAWKDWFYDFEDARQDLPSEKLQSLMARVNTNAMKLSMVVSAAESSSRVLEQRHWDQAMQILQPIIDTLPGIFREARAGNTETQDGLTQAVINLMTHGAKPLMHLKAKLGIAGFQPHRIDSTIDFMMKTGALERTGTPHPSGVVVKLAVNPNDHL